MQRRTTIRFPQILKVPSNKEEAWTARMSPGALNIISEDDHDICIMENAMTTQRDEIHHQDRVRHPHGGEQVPRSQGP